MPSFLTVIIRKNAQHILGKYSALRNCFAKQPLSRKSVFYLKNTENVGEGKRKFTYIFLLSDKRQGDLSTALFFFEKVL